MHAEIVCDLQSDSIRLVAGLLTTCRGAQLLVVIRFNVKFQPLRPYCEKMCTCFFNVAKSL